MSASPHPIKSDSPPPPSPSTRRDDPTNPGGESGTTQGTTHPTGPFLAPAGEPLTLNEAVRLHHAAQRGGNVLPLPLWDATLSTGLPLIGSPPATASGAVRGASQLGGEGDSGDVAVGRVDDLRGPGPGFGPPTVGPMAAQILEEARRIVDDVDSTLLFRDRPRVAHGGGRGRSSSPSSLSSNPSDPSVPRSSGRPRHPEEQDRQ